MKYGLTVTEIITLLLVKLVYQKSHIIGQVLRNLILSGLSDVADSLDQLLICSLDIVNIRHVNLQSNILYCVLIPKSKLILRNQKKRQRKLEENSMDVFYT